MNTLIVWNNGTNLSFYQVPNELTNPYFHVQGVCIQPDEHAEDQTHRTIEHLAVMLGEHDHAADSVPTLNEFIQQKRLEAPKRRRGRREKIIDAPWRQYAIGPGMEIHDCDRILHTGWLDFQTGEREAVETTTNKETVGAGRGGDGVGGDDRGEVKNPATDKRLKEHGGGSRGRQSGPGAGKGRQGRK